MGLNYSEYFIEQCGIEKDIIMNVYSMNGEDYKEEIGDIIDDIVSEYTFEEAIDYHIDVGISRPPKISGLSDIVFESILEQLWDQCGEYADNYTAKQSDLNELDEMLNAWAAKQKFNCYGVGNVKSEPLLNYISAEELKEYYD